MAGIENPILAAANAIGTTATNAAGAAWNAAADTVSAAGDAVAKAAKDFEDKDVEKHAPKVKKARKKLKGTEAGSILKSLGHSPLALTAAHDGQVKTTFPVPKEQTVLWADAEFDLRPSGIAVTEKGIFIKSNVELLAADDKDEKGGNTSRLSYYPWDYFDPAWFVEDDDANFALTVEGDHSKKFRKVCKSLAKERQKTHSAWLDAVSIDSNDSESTAKAAAVAAGAPLTAEAAVFAEQKAHVNNLAGHGEMAEEAINLLDKVHGLDARVVGRDNAKDGADRLVGSLQIQTKFYKSARGSLEACFYPADAQHPGQYRYMGDNGKPMQLEVPKDQYERVLEGFEKKIAEGKVPGVNNPDEAANIVRKGRLTYKQAVNLTKPGTIESLAYDAATGVVICSCAFGISFVAAAFMAYRKTGDMNESIEAGLVAGAQVFGISFIQHVVVSQLSRTGLASSLLAPSRYVVEKMGYRTAQTIVNGLRALSGKAAISGAAAAKQLAKIMRSNALTSAAAFVLFSIPETYKLALGKASGAQYATNVASLAGSIAGGAGGTVAAGVAVAKVGAMVGTGVAPAVGTVVGLAGGFIGGAAASAVAKTVGGVLYEGDGATFGRYFNAMVSCLAVEYLFDEGEQNALIKDLDEIKPEDFRALMEGFLSADKQEKVVREFLEPRYDSIAANRKHFVVPSDEDVVRALMALDDETEETA